LERLLNSAPKLAVILCVAFIVVREARRGYFAALCQQFPALKRRPFLDGFLVLLALTVTGLPFDPFLLERVQALSGPFWKAVIETGGFAGRHIHPWVMAVGFWALAVLMRRAPAERLARGILFSGALASLLTQALKFLLLRARPFGQEGAWSFLNISGLLGDSRVYQSFPSGDVVVVAGMIFYLVLFLSRFKAAWILALLPAATAMSRINADKHWPTDTLFAIGLGLMTAALIRGLEVSGTPVRVEKT